MWIILEPKKVALWNKRHFEEDKQRVRSMFKTFSTYICWINKKKMQHLKVSGAVRPLKRSLGVKWLRQIQFTVNQATRKRRQVSAIAFETAHFHAWRRFWTFVSFFTLEPTTTEATRFASSDISTVIDKIVAALVCGEAWNLFYQTSCM